MDDERCREMADVRFLRCLILVDDAEIIMYDLRCTMLGVEMADV